MPSMTRWKCIFLDPIQARNNLRHARPRSERIRTSQAIPVPAWQ